MNKPMKSLLKILFLVLLVIVYEAFVTGIEPMVVNELAIEQMKNYASSNSGIATYTVLRNYVPLLVIPIGVLLFRKELKNIIFKNKERRKNEEN